MAIPLIEVDYQRLCETAQTLATSGEGGHIHTTLPGCVITGSPRRAIVLEATAEGRAYVFYDETPIEERAKPLAILLHGADSVPDEQETLESASPAVDAMAGRMRQGKGHFHILNPVCLVNPNPGRWTILFEDTERGASYSVSDHRPLADIRLIERLIYAKPAG